MSAARRVRPLALGAALACAGCFADPGLPAQEASTGGATEAGASTSPDATTGPIDPATTTTEPDSTSTGEAASTSEVGGTAAPTCGEPGACEPGVTELTATACDPCGKLSRTCQPDCSWGGEACTPTVDDCEYWVYSPLAVPGGTWTAVKRGGGFALAAPDGSVDAAVELTVDAEVLVFAGGDIHILDTLSGQWTYRDQVADIFPEVEGVVTQAHGRYVADDDQYVLTLIAGAVEYRYRFVPEPASLFVQKKDCCTDWGAGGEPDLKVVRDVLFDAEGATGWFSGDAKELCDVPLPIPSTRFAAWISPTQVHLQDQAYCAKFFAPPLTYAEFGPFGAPGAPPGALVGGVALQDDRLYVFAGE